MSSSPGAPAVTTMLAEAAATVAKSLSGHRAPPAILTIFGAGGDLTKRLVVPALYNLVRAGKLSDDFAIIGVDHNEQTTEEWRQSLTEMMQAFDARRARAAGRVDRRKGLVMAHPPHALHARRLHAARNLQPAREAADGSAGAAERYGQCAVLSGGGRSVLRPGDRAAWPRGPDPTIGTSVAARDRRKAIRARPCIGRGPQCANPQDPVGRPDLSDRPFPRQGNGPEHHGAAVRQRHLRAAMEPRPYRSRADHRRRNRGRRAPRALLREDRRVTGHGAEPFVSVARHDRNGAADLIRCRRGAGQEDGIVRGDPSHLAGGRSTRPVWQRGDPRS